MYIDEFIIVVVAAVNTTFTLATTNIITIDGNMHTIIQYLYKMKTKY